MAEEPAPRALSLLPREEIDYSRMGVSAFVNDQRFGTISEQFLEVRDSLKLRYVRVLFGWNDDVQPSPDSSVDYSFYKDIARNIPQGVQALVIITGAPSWMADPANWSNGDPRLTFHREFLKPTIRKFRRNRKIRAFQVWNEPNIDLPESSYLDVKDSPEHYIELLRRSYRYIKRRAKGKEVVSAATTSIIQNYPETLQYNEALYSLGAEDYLDIWGVHIYGTSVERFLLPGGPTDFLNQLSKPIWVTESGRQGVNEQLNYVERVWPYLRSIVPGIDRLYFYQFTEGSSDASNTFGLKNLTVGSNLSDLYIHLRDR
ncbi:MAG: hypothetical protein KDD70_04970 [Bdellovibrionales bacterium]|nr:hypothetical protein [Bdellovibrionales bacterium]